MSNVEILKFVVENGADEKGIMNRFLGNVTLYGECFMEFLDEPNFELLDTSMEIKDYAKAFDAAHALKGVSGNLGLTSLYKAVCILVESLRAKNYTNVEAEHKEVKVQFEKLKNLYIAN